MFFINFSTKYKPIGGTWIKYAILQKKEVKNIILYFY